MFDQGILNVSKRNENTRKGRRNLLYRRLKCNFSPGFRTKAETCCTTIVVPTFLCAYKKGISDVFFLPRVVNVVHFCVYVKLFKNRFEKKKIRTIYWENDARNKMIDEPVGEPQEWWYCRIVRCWVGRRGRSMQNWQNLNKTIINLKMLCRPVVKLGG